ncbi:MAG: DUF84 family protein [Bacillus sp. (in: Bacteria)]|jgi:inosine/xanthosine triphosphatase|nr:DUF84 family protein [Bacillus sp. (in: firmicutes)]
MLIAIGSTNRTKVQAVKKICSHHWKDVTFLEVKAPSQVNDQPFSDEETIKGAIHRAQYCLEHTDASLAFGLEGGVAETPFGLFLCNWGVLLTREGKEYIAGGARIRLPEAIAERLRKGEELGPVMDDYSQQTGVRFKEGAVGILTGGLITRDVMYEHIVQLLVGQWKQKRGGC